MSKWFEMKPVQTGLKSLAASSFVLAGGFLYSKLSSYISSQNKSLEILSLTLGHAKAEKLAKIDEESVNLLARLEIFVRFFPTLYESLYESFYDAAVTKQSVYVIHDGQSKVSATSAFLIRKKYQAVIEIVREMRLCLEKTLSIPIEDFDEIAADINSKVEQECSDAIQDTF